NKEQHSSEILDLYDPNHPRPFTDKIRLLKRYFNKHPALEEHTEEIRTFARAALILAQERNTYLHGIFEFYNEPKKTVTLKSIRPAHDPQNPYIFKIETSAVPLDILKSFADMIGLANDKLEQVSRALFTPDAVSRLRKRPEQTGR